MPRPSYRDMIHEYLNRQHQYWSEFGIDALLGAHLDIKPSNTEAIHFLPDYLYNGMDSARDGNKPLVIERQRLLDFPETTSSSPWFTPLTAFISLLLLSLILYFLKNKKAMLVFDILFFTALGLTGILMAAMWLGRVDDVCRNNMNILWAPPTHFIAVFFIRKKVAWIKIIF